LQIKEKQYLQVVKASFENSKLLRVEHVFYSEHLILAAIS